MRRRAARLILAMILGVSCGNLSSAAINSIGDISPVPPAGGGNITSILRVGNNSLGIMEIAGGTGLNQNTDAIVGNNSDAIGYVTLSGVGSNWLLTLSSNDLIVGASGVGTVSLENFASVVVPGDTELGLNATGVGAINIDGMGTIWDADTAAVGVSGIGHLNITGGGRFTSDSSTLGTNSSGEGRVVIADALSQWRVAGGVTVGNSGRGTITLLDGGLLRTTSTSTIANAVSGTGLVEIIGAGSLWNSTNGNVTVGSSSVGKLHVFESGRLAMSSGDLLLASTTGSRGEIWVDGSSTVTTNGSIDSGAGESLLTISNGGEVIAASMTWGASARLSLQEGRLKVTGQSGFSSSGLVTGSGVIEAGHFINAQAGQNRGRVQVAASEHLRLTNTLVNNGLVDLDGGELELGGALANNFDIDVRNGANLRVGGAGLDNNNGSQLSISGGQVDIYGSVDNNAGGMIAVVGGATGVFHDLVTNNGTIFVSASSEIVMLEDLDFVPLSALSVELAPIGVNDDPTEAVGAVDASGDANLAGTLSVSLASGFTATLGDTYQIISAGSGIAGTFASESLPTLGGGLAFDVQYTSNSVILEVISVGLPGDFDFDGDVDGRDFLVWQRGGSPSPLSAGDLSDWQGNYGTGGFTAGSVAVPEPACFVLLGAATMILAWRR